MNDPNYDPSSIPVATLVDPGKRKMSDGCMVAIIIGIIFGIAMLIFAGIGFWIWADLSEVAERKRPKPVADRALRKEAIDEISEAKVVIQQDNKVHDHPLYKRVQEFVADAQSVFDETANPEMRELIDYDAFLTEFSQRTSFEIDSQLSRFVLLESLKTNVIGPAPFTFFEILHIDKVANNRYRVYMSYRTGYQSTEPIVWWISDENNQLKVYDWEQLELGLRATAESAIIADSEGSEERSYQEYADNCYEYLSLGDTVENYNQQRNRRLEILAECEQFTGPELLRPSVQVITARRWNAESESDRALALINKIPDKRTVPGAFRLKADIQFERGQFEQAEASYRAYSEMLGPTNYVTTQLATCYRELDDSVAERALYLSAVESISESDYQFLANLIELNSPSQNSQLFARIDSHPDRKVVFLFLVRAFYNSPFLADKFAHLVAHVEETAPDSDAAKFGKINLNPDLRNLQEGLKWIDQVPEDDPNGFRYNFWYDVEESDIVELFDSSQKRKLDFDTIADIHDYEGTISDDAMTGLCNSVLKTDPENYRAIYELGVVQFSNRNFRSAVEHLSKANKLIPQDDSFAETIRHQLLNALYEAGDVQPAIQLAEEHDMALELLRLKHAKDDFAGYQELLENLDPDSSEFQYRKALLDQHNGETEAALTALSKLVLAGKNEDPYGYSRFSYRDQLFKICRLENDPLRAVELAPTTAMFTQVSEQLIRDYDWPNCKKLLTIEGDDLNVERTKLRHRIQWDQGQYEDVIRDSKELLALPKSTSLHSVYDHLVRSAIRLGKLDQAMEFANRALESANRHDLICLVAILKQQPELATLHYRRLHSYQQAQLFHDPDLLGADIREVVSFETLPPRSLSYGNYAARQFELSLLFKKGKEPGRAELIKLFEGLGKDIRIEQTSLPGSTMPSWLVSTNKHRFFVSQHAVNDPDGPENWDNEELKRLIEDSDYRLDIVGYKRGPTTAEADYKTSLELIRCCMNFDVQGIGKEYQWLSAEKIKSFFALSKQNGPSPVRLFGFGDFQGDFHFLNSVADDEENDSRSRTFIDSLVEALWQFRDTKDPTKELVIQLELDQFAPERVSALVERIRRTGFRSVELEVTIQEDSKFDRSIRKGDRLTTSMYPIGGFELQTEAAVLKQMKSLD